MKGIREWNLHPATALNAGSGVIAVSMGFILLSGVMLYRDIRQAETLAEQVQSHLVKIGRTDEALTRSVRNASITRDSSWMDLYQSATEDMQAAFSSLKAHVGNSSILESVAALEALNDSMVAIEQIALSDAHGESQLSGQRYTELKSQFNTVLYEVHRLVWREIGQSHRALGPRLASMGAIVLLAILLGWFTRSYILRVLERYLDKRKRIEAEVYRARRAAEEANHAKSEFLSRMSHELRTPLNAILGFGQILAMDLSNEEDRESVEHILKAGRHLLSLIDEILDFARIEAGRLRISMEAVDVGSVIHEAQNLVQPLAQGNLVTIHSVPTEERLFVRADPQRLKQILLNFLSNAVKYNVSGGSVEISTTLEGERVQIRVRDSGPGIPDAMQDRVFQPFERLGAEERGLAEGTGLGLSLSKALAELMQGVVGFQSREGEGTTFWVVLPAAENPMEPLEEAVPPNHPEARTHSAKILYVEDNPSNRLLVERLISRRLEAQILCALDGRQGLQMVRDHSPDLVLLDLDLPDIRGYEVLERMQADERWSQIPVVILSADATESQIRRLLRAGASDYLTKPLDIPRFYSVIEAILMEKSSAPHRG